MSFTALRKHFEDKNLSSTEILSLIVIACFSWFLLVNLSRWLWIRRKWPPGPRGLPFVGYLPFLGKEPHKTLLEVKKKHGDVMGIYMGSKFTVILSEYNVAKEVYNHPGSLDRSLDAFQHINAGFGTLNGKDWLEQRRYVLSASRNVGLGKGPWENIFTEGLSDFIQELEAYNGKPVNVSESLGSSLTFNIMSLLLERKFKKEEADKIQLALNFSNAFSAKTEPSSPFTAFPGLRKIYEKFGIADIDKYAKSIREFFSFIREEIEAHKAKNEHTDADNFISSYLKKIQTSEVSNKKDLFSQSMLEGNLAVLLLGASDTIICSLGFLLKHMADYKDIQEKVYKEVIEVLGQEGRARYEERDKIPYTFAVVMESQRFSSLVPLSTSRRANQDIPVKNYIIPKGADISVNLYALHNDPNYWQEPEKFNPDRFLTGNGTKIINNPLSYAPFSMGRRNCPGEIIAWMEILTYFAEIVKNFEISIPPGEKSQNETVLGLVVRLKPHKLCFKKRN